MGALRQVRCALIAVCLGLVGATSHADESFAAPVVAVKGGYDRLDLTSRLQVGENVPAGWQPGHDANGRPGPQWRSVSEHWTGNHGTRDLDVWFRVDLLPEAAAPRDWFWVVTNPHLDLVELWLQGAGQTLRTLRAGDTLPAVQRLWMHRFPVLPLVLEPGLRTSLFMHVKTSGAAQVPVSLWQPAALWASDQITHSLLGVYVGLLVALLLYNLLLGIALREWVYLHYVAVVAFTCLHQLADTGLGSMVLWPDGATWTAGVQPVSQALAGLFSIFFARAFLAPAVWAPRLDAAMCAVMLVWLAVLAVMPWLSVPATSAMLAPVGLATIATLLVGAMVAQHTRREGAGSLAQAWAALLLGALLLVLVRAGWAPPHPLLVHAFMIGSAVGMVLLSFALADRSKARRAAHEDALALTVRQQVEKEAAQRASRDKSRFLVAVSHDLRQPLYALTLATESMARQRPLRHPGPMLAQMKSALESADGLLEALHTVARLETGSLKPHIVDFSMQSLLERLDHLYGPQAAARDLRWTVTPSIARVRSDPVLLERMLSNLVTNALRFTDRGGVVVACRSRTTHLLLQVWDTGKGMSPDDQDVMFGTRYRGVPESDTDNGIGLGLAIVKHGARLLDIELTMRSCPGRGSCFSLRVPLAMSVETTA